MNLRRELPVTLFALVAVIAIVVTLVRRPPQHEEAASIKQQEPAVAQNDQRRAGQSAIQLASARGRTTARSRGVYRPRTVAPTTQVALVHKTGSARSRGVYRRTAPPAAVASPRQGGMKIPGTSVGLWPKS